MITIQRVRVRWSAASRGASHANVRRGLDRPVALPASLPTGDLLAIHEVLADEAIDYARRDQVLLGNIGRAHDVALRLRAHGEAVSVEKLPGRAAYPRPAAPARLFTLAPGPVGRYRANFRFTGCSCNPAWYYEDWLIHISNGTVTTDRFIHRRPDHNVDNRVHLYGGPTPSTGRRRRESAEPFTCAGNATHHHAM